MGLEFDEVQPIGFDLQKSNIFTSVKPVDIDNGFNILEKQLKIVSKEYEIAILDTTGRLKILNTKIIYTVKKKRIAFKMN